VPARDDHIKQARHNAAFYGAFDRTAYPDWAATVLFYASLHYIDAFLANLPVPQHPGRHDVRDGFVARLAELKPIAVHYFKLKNSSRNARYYPPAPFSLTQVEQLERQHLQPIVSRLRQYIPI
jgi:hypothetical protein